MLHQCFFIGDTIINGVSSAVLFGHAELPDAALEDLRVRDRMPIALLFPVDGQSGYVPVPVTDTRRLEVTFSQVLYAVVIAVRIHLFPFRTEKLSSLALMVLPHQVGE